MASPRFPAGTRYTPVPDPVFGPLLEDVGDLTELKCTLRAIWLLHHKKGYPRYLTLGELTADRVLLSGVQGQDQQPADMVRTAMTQAVQRGTFLTCTTGRAGEEEPAYLLNTEASHKALPRLARLMSNARDGPLSHSNDQEALPQRPNIFALYEDNIGMLTPLLADELRDAEQRYPPVWIEEAIRLTVESTTRPSWKYVERILERWAAEGRGDGEPGRYSKKSDRGRFLQEYLRRRGPLPDR